MFFLKNKFVQKMISVVMAALMLICALPISALATSTVLDERFQYHSTLYYDASDAYNYVFGDETYSYECYIFLGRTNDPSFDPVIFIHNGNIVRDEKTNRDLLKMHFAQSGKNCPFFTDLLDNAQEYIDIAKQMKFRDVVEDVSGIAVKSLGAIGAVYLGGGTVSVSAISSIVAKQTLGEFKEHIFSISQIITDAQLGYFYATVLEMESTISKLNGIKDFTSFKNCETYFGYAEDLIKARACAAQLTAVITADLEDTDTFLEVLASLALDAASGYVGGFCGYMQDMGKLAEMQKNPDLVAKIIMFAGEIAKCDEDIGKYQEVLLSIAESDVSDLFSIADAHKARIKIPTLASWLEAVNKSVLSDISDSTTPESPTYPSAPFEDFIYTIKNDSVTITDYIGNGTTVTIPSSIAGYHVTTIGVYTFADCTDITKVVIPSSITIIGNWAFSNCTSLKNITIPNSVTYIGIFAFNNCTSLTDITIGNGVVTIGESAFSNCTSLSNINISYSVTDIGDYVFSGCNSLNSIQVNKVNPYYCNDDQGALYNKNKTKLIRAPGARSSITVPSSVKRIGDSAFSYSDKLTCVIIPRSVIEIGEYAFYNCDYLKTICYAGTQAQWETIIIEPGNGNLKYMNIYYGQDHLHSFTNYTSDNNATCTKDGTETARCDKCTVTNTRTDTGSKKNHSYGKWIERTAPTCIAEGLEYRTCSVCRKEEIRVIVANGHNWSTEWTVDIEATPTSEGSKSRHCINCEEKTDVTAIPKLSVFPTEDFACAVKNNTVTITDYIGTGTTVIIPSTIAGYPVTTIGVYAFADCADITKVVIPNSITVIGNWAFSNCTSLNDIIIPDSVTYIGMFAFNNCSSLTNITIGNGVVTIGESAFSNCIGLININIPYSVTNIGNYVFSGCNNLSNIWVHESNLYYCNDNQGALYNKNKTKLIRAPGALDIITVPSTVTNIGISAFSYSNKLTYVIIPRSVTNIGEYAFYNCDSLETVYYRGTQAQWDMVAVSENNTCLGNTVRCIGELRFAGASLTLHSNLAINYKVDKTLFEEVGYTAPYVAFKIGDTETKVSKYTVSGDYYVFDFTNIAPHQIGDKVYATLYAIYDGTEYASDTSEYGVSVYCYNMLGKYNTDAYAELRTLLVDLLNYGAQSQIYMNYNTENLVNAALTNEQAAWGTTEAIKTESVLEREYEKVDSPVAYWAGAGLNLKDSVTVRFIIKTESIDGLAVRITDNEKNWTVTSNKFEAAGDYYYVYFSGLDAAQMSKSIYATVYNGETAVSNTIRYSIESYADSKIGGADTILSDLLIAMMKYGNSAYKFKN